MREVGAPARGDGGGAGTDVEAQGRKGGKVRGGRRRRQQR
jgi:hypothetical protein